MWASEIPWLAPWLGEPGRAPALPAAHPSSILPVDIHSNGAATVVRLGELLMILDLHRQGLSITAIARRTGRDPKTVRKYIERGLEPPAYGPRRVGRPNKIAPYLDYLRERVAAFPELTAMRLDVEIRELGYTGAYTAVKRFVAAIRPKDLPKPFEVRFEPPPGRQAQVDFARFVVPFSDDPGISRVVWLFSMVLGHSRFLWARFVMHQDLQAVLRCHVAAFVDLGGVPAEILYDRIKTAVTGEDGEGQIIYNRALLTMAQHYGFLPKACRPYRAKTKGKVERPIRYVRESFFYGRTFLNDPDLDAQAEHWLRAVANVRCHATTKERPLDRFEREEFAALKPLALQPYRSLVVPAPKQTSKTVVSVPAIAVERRPLAVYDRLIGAST